MAEHVSEPSSAGTVVALGGGHGLAVALRAIRRYAGAVTAVVNVADDGGSSGRLRRDLGVVPPGDMRTCLVALAADANPWADALQYRFGGGELDGHALGNLMLVGLTDTLGDLAAALDEVGDLLGVVGTVRPATTEPVVLKAQVDPGSGSGSDAGITEHDSIEGQLAVANTRGRIRRVELVPGDVPAHPDALRAIEAADQIVLAPGSLYTSLLAVLAVPALREAIADSAARTVQVCNLRPQIPETEGLDAVDHLRAVVDHGVRVDEFLLPRDGELACNEQAVRALGSVPISADVANGPLHDPAKLASALRDLLVSSPRNRAVANEIEQ